MNGEIFKAAGPTEIPASEWETHQVKKGDRYRFTYTERFFTTQGQVDSMLATIATDPRYDVESYQRDGKKHIITVKVVENPFPLAIVVAAVGASAVSAFLFLSLDKVEQIAGPFAGPTLLLIAGAAFMFIFKR